MFILGMLNLNSYMCSLNILRKISKKILISLLVNLSRNVMNSRTPNAYLLTFSSRRLNLLSSLKRIFLPHIA